jgi:SulP family sulfate permease
MKARLTSERWLPAMSWLRGYDRATLGSDVFAALIVTLMLVPQSLAYAMLAGLPPQIGLYASIAPLVAYAAFGTSRTLSVGPVAVVSLMTAAAAGNIAQSGSVGYVEAALVLAFLSGVMLLAMAFHRLCISEPAPGDVDARPGNHSSRGRCAHPGAAAA